MDIIIYAVPMSFHSCECQNCYKKEILIFHDIGGKEEMRKT